MEKKLICHCFGYSEEDIVKDIIDNAGISSILKRMPSEKKKGACNCKHNHPKGK